MSPIKLLALIGLLSIIALYIYREYSPNSSGYTKLLNDNFEIHRIDTIRMYGRDVRVASHGPFFGNMGQESPKYDDWSGIRRMKDLETRFKDPSEKCEIYNFLRPIQNTSLSIMIQPSVRTCDEFKSTIHYNQICFNIQEDLSAFVGKGGIPDIYTGVFKTENGYADFRIHTVHFPKYALTALGQLTPITMDLPGENTRPDDLP